MEKQKREGAICGHLGEEKVIAAAILAVITLIGYGLCYFVALLPLVKVLFATVEWMGLSLFLNFCLWE